MEEQNQLAQKLSEKELYDLKRQEKLQARETTVKKRRIKKNLLWSAIGILIIVTIGGLIRYGTTRPSAPESDIVSRNGIHWHPELSILVKNVKQEIPAGLGGVEMSIHTHDSTGVIHLEIGGLVRKSDITLGRFFKVWGKDMRSFGTNIKMTVNGKENTEYENYVMRDKDKIELQYE